MKPLPAHVSYRCFGCNIVVDGNDARWLQDEHDLAYPFCSGCVNGAWPLSEIPGPDYSRVYELWSGSAIIIDWDSH